VATAVLAASDLDQHFPLAHRAKSGHSFALAVLSETVTSIKADMHWIRLIMDIAHPVLKTF